MPKPDFAPYRPSNGTEGMYFMAEYCDRCVHDAKYQRTMDGEDGCEIILYTMAFVKAEEEYPRHAWVYMNGKPTCLFFREGGEDDLEPKTPVDPDQLDLFLELPQLQTA